MKNILVVDDEQMILRLATEALKGYGEGYNVLTALNGKQAMELLDSSDVSLVLTDLKMPVMDGYELMAYMSKKQRTVPAIVMTSFGSPEKLKDRAVLQYIEKPFEVEVLREKITSVFKSMSDGQIQGFSLDSFLQAIEVEQKTISVILHSKGKSGSIHFDNGELIDAEFENTMGEEAALKLLSWEDAEIDIEEMRKRKTTITVPLATIIIKAASEKEEKTDTPEEEKDEILVEAIKMAEGHHYKESHGLISKFLNQNPRSHEGWLWYSRIIVTMKSIEAALNNAVKLSPKDPVVVEETKRFNFAKNNVGDDQIRRCPFCWSPVNAKAVNCSYCKSHLFIHKNFFTSSREGDKTILNEAIDRYEKVIAREKNVNAQYYLSMAFLNLEQWDDALTILQKTVNLAPGKKVFSDQLKSLVNHMASIKSALEKGAPKKEKTAEIEEELQVGAKKKKILVVEDSSTTRKVITITLSQKGYDIVEAKDGLEALSKLNEVTPDLILLDIILPKMDGYKVLNIIKSNELFKHIPVIMLTSRDGLMSKVKGRMAGSAAYLTKPF